MTDLTTAAAVRAYGNIPAEDIADDDLAAIVTRASAAVRGYCSRDITAGSYSEPFSGPGGAVYVPKQWPITSVTSLAVGSTIIPAAGSLDGAGYRFDQDRIVLQGYAFARGMLNCLLVYDAGVADVPADVEEATIITALEAYRGRERDPAVRQENDTGNYSASYQPMGIPQRARDILNQTGFVRRF